MNPDLINGVFELVGGVLYILNIKELYQSKKLEGVSVLPTTFFTSWGLWNLFYYPSLDQWFSFFGGLLLVTVNAIWVAMAFYYARKGEKCQK